MNLYRHKETGTTIKIKKGSIQDRVFRDGENYDLVEIKEEAPKKKAKK